MGCRPFSHDIVKSRLDNLRRIIAQEDLDALFLANYSYVSSSLYSDYNIFYVSNLLNRFESTIFILTPNDYSIWVDEMNLERAKRETWLEGLKADKIPSWRSTPDSWTTKVCKMLRDKMGRGRIKVGFNGQILRGGVVLALSREENVEWVDVSSQLVKSRLVKDELEMEALRRAGKIADEGIEAVINGVTEGITELELTGAAEMAMRRSGAQGSWYFYGFGFVAFGSQTAFAPPSSAGDSPSQRKLKRGDLVTLDFTPIFNGYAADVARTFVFGRPTKEQGEAWNLTKEILDAQISSLRGGMTVRDLIKAAHRPAKNHPFGKHLKSLGHGIGLYDDVYPLFTPEFDEVVLPKGLSLCVEPTLMIKGLGVIRLEDDFILTSSGAERLTKAEVVENISR